MQLYRHINFDQTAPDYNAVATAANESIEFCKSFIKKLNLSDQSYLNSSEVSGQPHFYFVSLSFNRSIGEVGGKLENTIKRYKHSQGTEVEKMVIE